MASSKTVIIAAIVGNGIIAVTKFIAAAASGSAAMLAEAIHSLVDTGNGALLLFGIARSKRAADVEHPFGYGKELYFWTLIVAMIIFALGGGVSFYEGLMHLLHPPEELSGDPTMSYWVLGIAFVVEGVAWYLALLGFLAAKGKRGVWRAVRTSKDPTTFAVLFEDTAAMIGIVIAAFGIWLSHAIDSHVPDGLASMGIGLVLAVVAIVLARESRGLLVGESAGPAVVEHITAVADQDPDVVRIHLPLTMHLGPQDILVNLDIAFDPALDARGIERAVDRIEQGIRSGRDERFRIYIEAESVRPGPRLGSPGEETDLAQEPTEGDPQ